MLSPLIRPYHSPKTPFEVYSGIYGHSEVSFFLDSSYYQRPDQRYSYLGWDPFLEISIDASGLRLQGEIAKKDSEKNIFPVLNRILKKYSIAGSPRPFFTGGMVGYWAYEMAEHCESIRFRKKTRQMPKLYLGFYNKVIVYDHLNQHYWLCVNVRSKKENKNSAQEFSNLQSIVDNAPSISQPPFEFDHFKPEISRQEFYRMIRKAKAYIAAGDIYQANLSQRFTFDYQGSPLRVYEKLRTINPSPFASFMKIRDLEIVSNSPERLVRKQGRWCETRPIAGTRPRKAPGKSPKAMIRSLLASQKERAEHIMLVDLERNDLGRVCDFRTVRVHDMMTTEQYSHVIHIVSKITGRLKKGKDALDLFRAVFPGGTITGCPKVRCMQIIDELEKSGRGIYTGSIGYLDFYGNMDLNIVIRTLVFTKNKGFLQVGAGIVHDSIEKKEYEETLHKAEAMREALRKAQMITENERR